MRTYAHRVDAHQAETVELLRAAGYAVAVTSRLGGGFPDLVVGKGTQVWLVELKERGKNLTPAEQQFHESWASRARPVLIARDPFGLLRYLQAQTGRRL